MSTKIIIKLNTKTGIRKVSINKNNKKFYTYNKKTKSYDKKSSISIKRLKFESSLRKKEKKTSKKVIQQIKIKKEKIIKIKIKEVKPIERKLKPLTKYEEEKDTGYDVTLYEFTCKVSDIKLTHSYGIRSEYADDVLDLHNGNFPDHEMISYEYISDHHVNYESRQNYNGITSNQKEFLHRLGVNTQIIGSIKTKREATEMITRLQQ